MNISAGFSLIELMITMAVGSIFSVAVLNTYSSQSAMFVKQERYDKITNDSRDVYEIVSRTLRQAVESSIVLTPEDGLQADFIVPAGFPVWPNVTAPYMSNAIRIRWDKGTNKINVATSENINSLDDADILTLAGSATGANSQVINMSIINNKNGTYTLTVGMRAGLNGPITSLTGQVIPRN